MTLSFSEKEIDPLNLPDWLAAQELFPKFYWKCRATGIETVALGSCKNFSEIPHQFPDKLYGAISFPSNHKDSLWSDFSSSFFFLPQVEIVQSSTKTVLKVRGPTPPFKTPMPLLDYPNLCQQKDLPNLEDWDLTVKKALKIIQSKELQKIVLARRSTFVTHDHPFSWLKKLLSSSVNSTVFAFQQKPSSLFLGATPEMLYQREGRVLKTESVAGTRRKEESSSELQESSKDKKEFSYVKSFLCDSLTSLCEEFSHEPLDSLLETSHLKHLYNRFNGILKPEVEDLDILSLLHPTPAVGGLPQKEGVEKILSLEPFDRGLYSGALGWVSPLDSSFAVTIRSALITSGLLHAFAGTGIVEGSDSQKEWNELEAKLSHWKTTCQAFH